MRFLSEWVAWFVASCVVLILVFALIVFAVRCLIRAITWIMERTDGE